MTARSEAAKANREAREKRKAEEAATRAPAPKAPRKKSVSNFGASEAHINSAKKGNRKLGVSKRSTKLARKPPAAKSRAPLQPTSANPPPPQDSHLAADPQAESLFVAEDDDEAKETVDPMPEEVGWMKGLG
ncbi:hypothetical protein K469DRAFT_697449 [Zopfia rhizophila CBS 207.26]|uniref:Uncharacterized protein n=1 Tax=Zopfia rhizophila CBS 207.26 TaxID=1314779 RepID=A0A6A6DFH9_9PEZI|nr:hypothetical protein K469DRAFT_697449 [Zopfia rhizophila CBS 207.26]